MSDFSIEDEAMDIIIAWMKEHKPKRVVELGSGQSTKVFAKHCKELYTYEHDANYLFKRKPKNVKQIHAPLKDGWYDAEFPDDIDLLIIDGPPQVIGDLARLPRIDLLKKTKGVCFLHDSCRPEEIQIAHLIGTPTFYDTKWGLARIDYET